MRTLSVYTSATTQGVETMSNPQGDSLRSHNLRMLALAIAIAIVTILCIVALVSGGSLLLNVPSSSGSGPIEHTSSSLCESVPALKLLVVYRVGDSPGFSFPATVVVSRATLVRDVAKALCNLPKFPRLPVAMFCPIDFGPIYHLVFSDRNRIFPIISADPRGCQVVTGISPPRWADPSPKFWHTLGVAMRLKSPTWASFTDTPGTFT
jgi:hypothetical protein